MFEEDMTEEELKKLVMMFGCEHSTLLSIMSVTLSHLRDFPVDVCHPSMAAMFMAVNSLKAAFIAAYANGDRVVGEHLQKMYVEIVEVIHKYHSAENAENLQLFQRTDVPEAFRKAFDKDSF